MQGLRGSWPPQVSVPGPTRPCAPLIHEVSVRGPSETFSYPDIGKKGTEESDSEKKSESMALVTQQDQLFSFVRRTSEGWNVPRRQVSLTPHKEDRGTAK